MANTYSSSSYGDANNGAVPLDSISDTDDDIVDADVANNDDDSIRAGGDESDDTDTNDTDEEE